MRSSGTYTVSNMRLNCSCDRALHPEYVARKISAAFAELAARPPRQQHRVVLEKIRQRARPRVEDLDRLARVRLVAGNVPLQHVIFCRVRALLQRLAAAVAGIVGAANDMRERLRLEVERRNRRPSRHMSHADFQGSSPALIFAFMNSRSARVCKIPGCTMGRRSPCAEAASS